MEKLSNFFKEAYYFLTSSIFLKNFFSANAIIIVVLFLVFQWLQCFTRHGEEVTVPDFRGQTLPQVQELLKRKHLQIAVIDSTYDGKKLPLSIIDQNPLPTKVTGLRVKKDRTIYITVNSETPPSVRLPNIWNKDFDYVKKVLENYDLKVNVVDRKPDRAVNTVLEVQYKGEVLKKPRTRKEAIRIPRGSTIGVVVADGGGSMVQVPKIRCKTYAEAKFVIDSYGLNIESVNIDGTVTDSLSAYVYQQNPPYSPEDLIQVGSPINLWLTQSMPSGCEGDDDLILTPTDDTQDTDDFEDDGFGGDEFEVEGEYEGGNERKR